MGRDLLRREVLKMRNGKSGIGSCIRFFVFLFLISHVWAQDDGARPLRTVPPDPSLLIYNYSPAYGSSLPAVSSPLLATAALQQPLTQYYIDQYSSSGGIEYLNAVMERANIFLPFIREEVARRNMPPELAYLPIIESSFEITARSKSGAVGLWQFMANSISPFGIKVNDFVDERRDFIKSTRGALQKLEDNYRALGNWELALAAYNAGLGAVTRAVQRTKVRDYWELCRKKELKQETEHYIPKLLAVAWVLSQPRRFGINIWHKSFQWTAIPLPRQVSLDMLAEEADIEKDLLRRLNAQLLYGISPADSGFRLIIPAAHAEKVNDVLRREDLKLVRYFYHDVRQGDTLWSMSRHYGTPLDMIEQHNPGISNRYLKIGETVVIPAFGEVAPQLRPAVTQIFDGSHVVKKGETLWSLGRMYGLDPQILAEENGMRLTQILHEGRTLKVPIIE
jgi:membrane-bound lytic murein transglycosylase D